MDIQDDEFVILGREDIQDFNLQGVLPLSNEKVAKIRRWLSPTDYSATSSEWRKHHTSHLSGTGNWILNTDQYRQWHDASDGGLWIKAIAGAGKSVIAGTIIAKLASEEKTPVLYFFFRHIVSANQKFKSLVRDFLAQVLQYSPPLQNDLFKLIDEDQRSLDSMSSDDLWDILVSTLTQLPRVYCIVDALDEMETTDERFIDRLVTLTQKSPVSVKVLMTSRPLPRIEQYFRRTNTLTLVLHPQLIDPDIVAYVTHRTSGLRIPQRVRSDFHHAMCKKAAGHFLYARLMMDKLLDAYEDVLAKKQDLLTALDELPTPMANMYTQMLREHSRRSGTPQTLQVVILQWVTRAERPLRLLELSSLVDTKKLMPWSANDAKSIVREACGPLLEIFEDGTVHPIHHSFTEYLYDEKRLEGGPEMLQFPVLSDQKAQETLTNTCLQHLASGWHMQDPEPTYPSNERLQASQKADHKNALKLKYPYLDYITKYWSCHLSKSGARGDRIVTALDEVFTRDKKLLRAWLDWNLERQPYNKARDNLDSWSPLHAAAYTGITCFVEILLHRDYDIERLTSAEETPLSLAAQNGHYETVQVLLQHKTESDNPDIDGLRPLHHVARLNHWKVAKLLLEAGADPYAPKTRQHHLHIERSTIGATPVQYACSLGHLETMMTIVPFLEGEDLQKALLLALTFGKTEIAIKLLERSDIDVNYCFNNQTPLYLACRARDLTTMRLLLEKGAEANMMPYYSTEPGVLPRMSVHDPSGQYVTLLCAFLAHSSHENLSRLRNLKSSTMLVGVSMLLDAGIDPNITNPDGSTILHTLMTLNVAFRNDGSEHQEYIKPVLALLLERGLSAHSLANDGSNALHLASGVNNDTLDMLLDCKLDINATRKIDGKTPLMVAIERDEVAVARHLLQRGADVNVTDWNGNTLLHLYRHRSQSGSGLDLMKALITAGADVNSRNRDGDTALHVSHFNIDLTRLFMQSGFDLESKNKLGQTLLFKAATNLCLDSTYCQLVEIGADIKTRDNQGRTILHAFVQHIRDGTTKTANLVRQFVDKGLDPEATDSQGNNLWHATAGVSAPNYGLAHIAVMKLLNEYGVSPAARNFAGQTAFHIACAVDVTLKSHSPLVFLLQRSQTGLNMPDHDQVRPLHLTASYDLLATCFLLDHGADCTVETIEGQTPLMVACRTRQCDVVCRLLDHYREKDVMHLIDHVDHVGRTALHYACRSGRPETVALLLGAGSSAQFKDRNGVSPLHYCASYLDEDASWQAPLRLDSDGRKRAAYVLTSDLSRPNIRSKQQDPIRIRETIRLLIRYGADTSFLKDELATKLCLQHDDLWCVENATTDGSPLAAAIASGCSPMISELLLVRKELSQKDDIQGYAVQAKNIDNNTVHGEDRQAQLRIDIPSKRHDQANSFREKLTWCKTHYPPDPVAASVKIGDCNFSLVRELLSRDEEPLVRKLTSFGACFDQSVLQILVSWGFADLLYQLSYDAACTTEAENEKVSVFWTTDWDHKHLQSILLNVLEREIPNFAVLKMVVSQFCQDTNKVFPSSEDSLHTQTYVHRLAEPAYWWQTQALAYLLDSGAKVDTENSKGETPLVVALQKDHGVSYDPIRVRVVEILLAHGANPNAIDKNGLSCLNIAARQPEYIQMLFEHGADPLGGARPFIFDAIELQDIGTIKRVIASGADLNRLSSSNVKVALQPNGIAKMQQDRTYALPRYRKDWFDSRFVEYVSAYTYPIHMAASKVFNVPENLTRALEIIELLLKNGANPFLSYEDGNTILHCLIMTGGITEPFFTLPEFDLELRDGKGRTPLLAACDSPFWRRIGREWTTIKDNTINRLITRGASITAVDNEGCNALHYLINTFPRGKTDLQCTQTCFAPFLSSLLLQADFKGRTPYHLAVSKGDIDLIQLLLSHGADPSMADPIDNTTALHYLAPKLVSEDIYLLRRVRGKKYARPKSEPTSKLGQVSDTPHTGAGSAQKGSLEQATIANQRPTPPLFAQLLARGLSIDHQDVHGEPPLFKVAELGASAASWTNDDDDNDKDGSDEEASSQADADNGSGLLLSAFQALCKAGADLQARNLRGESVLHKLAKHLVTKEGGHENARTYSSRVKDMTQSFRWLVSKGLDVTWEDNEQRTCLDVAAVSGATWLTKMYQRE